MQRVNRGLWLVLLLPLCVAPVWAGTSVLTKSVLVNTDAADFTVIAAVTNQSIKITHLDAQNLGTTGKVTFQLCDGACGSATSKIGPFELSPAAAGTHGGSYTFACSSVEACAWNITPGNALVAQVDTGAVNSVRGHVTYQAYSR